VTQKFISNTIHQIVDNFELSLILVVLITFF